MADLDTRNGLSIGAASPTSPQRNHTAIFNPPISPQVIPGNMEYLQSVHYNRFPNNPGKYYVILGMSAYDRPFPLRPAVINVTDYIVLPLPLHLIDNHMVDYIQAPLGFLGAATHQALGHGQSLYNSVFPKAKTAAQTGEQAVSRTPSAVHAKGVGDSLMGAAIGAIGGGILGGVRGAVVGGAAGAFVGKENIKAVAQAAALQAPFGVGPGLQAWSGYSPNQFFTVLLKGPTFKRNEFIWKLSPNSPDEAMAINKIIRKLNNAMAPGLFAGGLMFSFPRVFTISIMPNSRYMFKFKPCVLENLTANYTGAGRNAFLRADSVTAGRNAPEFIELRLRFMELEFWLTGDFGQDHGSDNPADVYGANWFSQNGGGNN